MTGVEGLFRGIRLEVGNVFPYTVGEGVDRAKLIADVMNELEGRGFVTSYTEYGRRVDFKLDRRRNQNA